MCRPECAHGVCLSGMYDVQEAEKWWAAQGNAVGQLGLHGMAWHGLHPPAGLTSCQPACLPVSRCSDRTCPSLYCRSALLAEEVRRRQAALSAPSDLAAAPSSPRSLKIQPGGQACNLYAAMLRQRQASLARQLTPRAGTSSSSGGGSSGGAPLPGSGGSGAVLPSEGGAASPFSSGQIPPCSGGVSAVGSSATGGTLSSVGDGGSGGTAGSTLPAGRASSGSAGHPAAAAGVGGDAGTRHNAPASGFLPSC